jgi:hypothetical protein
MYKVEWTARPSLRQYFEGKWTMRISSAGMAFIAAGLCASSAHAQSTVYAIDVRANPNRLISFPSNAPALNIVSASAGFDGFAMDFNRDATILYGIAFVAAPGPQVFGTIDLLTGNFTPIAPVTGAGSAEANWSGLSFDPTTNTMYASAVATGSNNLYTINLANGVTTLVGSMGTTPLFIDIAIDVNGNMFAHDIGGDTLHSVNKATGATTLIGPTTLLANFAQGMDFDWATNTLYAAIYTGGGVGNYVSINTATGAATVIFVTTPWNAEMEMAIQSPAPGGCYANCDNSTTAPILNVGDFTCFLQRFAAGDAYANCDNSTTAPVLNVGDFTCFLQRFAAGCP